MIKSPLGEGFKAFWERAPRGLLVGGLIGAAVGALTAWIAPPIVTAIAAVIGGQGLPISVAAGIGFFGVSGAITDGLIGGVRAASSRYQAVLRENGEELALRNGLSPVSSFSHPSYIPAVFPEERFAPHAACEAEARIREAASQGRIILPEQSAARTIH